MIYLQTNDNNINENNNDDNNTKDDNNNMTVNENDENEEELDNNENENNNANVDTVTIDEGFYTVGKDIEPGEYKFTPIDEGFTSISTFKEENGAYNSKNYYPLNIKDEKETDVTLNEGEILNIQNAVTVKIEKKL
ncbi:hypothetical protein ETI10_04055 [Macrococcoides goetzii]|nr:hypothetical protein [Macrococcus goetzii]TDM42278.1 hypothetical protein ETI10_04055 [Macrococcus goetzii]